MSRLHELTGGMRRAKNRALWYRMQLQKLYQSRDYLRLTDAACRRRDRLVRRIEQLDEESRAYGVDLVMEFGGPGLRRWNMIRWGEYAYLREGAVIA